MLVRPARPRASGTDRLPVDNRRYRSSSPKLKPQTPGRPSAADGNVQKLLRICLALLSSSFALFLVTKEESRTVMPRKAWSVERPAPDYLPEVVSSRPALVEAPQPDATCCLVGPSDLVASRPPVDLGVPGYGSIL